MAAKIKLSKEQQQYLAVGVLFLGGFGFAYIKYFWSPTAERIRTAQEEIEKVTKEIETARANAARLPRIEAELVLLNQQAIEAEGRLPKTRSVPNILVTMTTLAKRSGVELLSFTPGNAVSREYFTELTYPMIVKGPFHSVGKFFAAVALEERIYNVIGVSFPGGGDAAGMSVTFTLISYQYKG